LAILNPEHLLEQADMLLRGVAGGKPRQANLRRAVSAAYYAVFHHVLTACADEFVGKTLRGDWRYTLVYRSVDHGKIEKLCKEAVRPGGGSYKTIMQGTGFEASTCDFAILFSSLYAERHRADYDPSHQITTIDVKFAIYQARSAIARFNATSATGRKSFITLLTFKQQ
jgi:uncharacterized protein (UPF0332 family)